MPDQYTLLLELRRAEGAARGLSKVPHDLYETTATYLNEVRRTFESELRENPSSRKGEIARQTYQRASQVARDVIEARMTKILSQAFQASIGGGKELPNSLAEERTMFDAVIAVLRQHRGAVAPFLEPVPAPAPAPGPRPATLAPRVERAASPEARPAPAMAIVRVLKDSGSVEIGSETVELRKEDLVSLPEPRLGS